MMRDDAYWDHKQEAWIVTGFPRVPECEWPYSTTIDGVRECWYADDDIEEMLEEALVDLLGYGWGDGSPPPDEPLRDCLVLPRPAESPLAAR